MNLSMGEMEVVNIASGSDIVNAGSDAVMDRRTFYDLDKDGLMRLLDKHGDYIGNDSISRLPSAKVFREFVEEYPFFRVNGMFHNLTRDAPLRLFITGIEYTPRETNVLRQFDMETLSNLKRRFTDTFYTADVLHMTPEEFAVGYIIDRHLEVEG